MNLDLVLQVVIVKHKSLQKPGPIGLSGSYGLGHIVSVLRPQNTPEFTVQTLENMLIFD